MVRFRGKGAKEVNPEVFNCEKPSLNCTSRMLGSLKIFIVPRVKLLGVIQNPDGTFDNEIHHRHTGGNIGLTEIARPLQSRRVGVRGKTKLILLENQLEVPWHRALLQRYISSGHNVDPDIVTACVEIAQGKVACQNT